MYKPIQFNTFGLVVFKGYDNVRSQPYDIYIYFSIKLIFKFTSNLLT